VIEFPIIPRVRRPKKLICKVGINDADYQVDVRLAGARLRCPYFTTWSNMLTRCYNEKALVASPTYSRTNVCEQWLTFSNFKAWMETQDWQGKELDKDLLGNGFIYSPDTCVFVDRLTNCFLLDCRSRAGLYKIGVDLRGGRFRARCSNPFIKAPEHLGYFDSENAAHLAWRKRKSELAKILACTQPDSRVAERLTNMFSVIGE